MGKLFPDHLPPPHLLEYRFVVVDEVDAVDVLLLPTLPPLPGNRLHRVDGQKGDDVLLSIVLRLRPPEAYHGVRYHLLNGALRYLLILLGLLLPPFVAELPRDVVHVLVRMPSA